MGNEDVKVPVQNQNDSDKCGFIVNPDSTADVNVSSMSVHSEYSGPIPTPDMMIKYGEIDPSFPERIMKMAESLCQSQADAVKAGSDFKRAETVSLLRGQWIVLSIIALTIAGIIFLAILGHDSVAISLASCFALFTASLTFLIWRPGKNQQKSSK